MFKLRQIFGDGKFTINLIIILKDKRKKKKKWRRLKWTADVCAFNFPEPETKFLVFCYYSGFPREIPELKFRLFFFRSVANHSLSTRIKKCFAFPERVGPQNLWEISLWANIYK